MPTSWPSSEERPWSGGRRCAVVGSWLSVSRWWSSPQEPRARSSGARPVPCRRRLGVEEQHGASATNDRPRSATRRSMATDTTLPTEMRHRFSALIGCRSRVAVGARGCSADRARGPASSDRAVPTTTVATTVATTTHDRDLRPRRPFRRPPSRRRRPRPLPRRCRRRCRRSVHASQRRRERGSGDRGRRLGLRRGRPPAFTAYQRTVSGWQQVFGPWLAHLGRNGFAPSGAKREGDGRTPSGSARPLVFFGACSIPGVKFEYRLVVGRGSCGTTTRRAERQPVDRHAARRRPERVPSRCTCPACTTTER